MKPVDLKKIGITLDHLIAKYNKAASIRGFQGPHHVYIYMPKYLIDTYTIFVRETKYDPLVKYKPMSEYKGYKIIQGYEDKLIIAHENYPHHSSPELKAEEEIPEALGMLAQIQLDKEGKVDG
jgi:hypothetical protein